MCPFSKTPFHKLLGLEFFFLSWIKMNCTQKQKKKWRPKWSEDWVDFRSISVSPCLNLCMFTSKVSWDNIQIYLPLEERQKNWFWVQCWLDIGTLQRLVTEWIWFGASKRLCPRGGERWNAGRPWRSARRWWERAGQLYGSMRPEKESPSKINAFSAEISSFVSYALRFYCRVVL